MKLLAFLKCHVYWIEIFWCVVKHWVRLYSFFYIAMVSSFWIWCVRFPVKILFLQFILWFWKHKVLSRLLIYQILNFLVLIHLIDLWLSFWFLQWNSTVYRARCFNFSLKWVKTFSCFNIVWILLAHIRWTTFNWNYFVRWSWK